MTATFASAAFPRTDAVALTAPFKRMPTRVIPSGTISRMNVPLALMPRLRRSSAGGPSVGTPEATDTPASGISRIDAQTPAASYCGPPTITRHAPVSGTSRTPSRLRARSSAAARRQASLCLWAAIANNHAVPRSGG